MCLIGCAKLKIIIDPAQATLDKLHLPEQAAHSIGISVLRLDKIHPVISGNKWFKLREHLQLACTGNYHHILTFGGAWSNHIVATACAAHLAGLPSTGVIRGEPTARLSDTLAEAHSYGMHLKFISREEYAHKEERETPPGTYVIPEGGGGPPGISGSMGIGDWIDRARYSHILCAIGTGTMFLGLAAASVPGQQVIGIPVLKGMHDLPAAWREQLPDPSVWTRCRIEPGYPSGYPSDYLSGYHFGGYARHTDALLEFMRRFYRDTGIPTDFVYTGKLFFAVLDMAARGMFPTGSQILVIHSGGLQGNRSLPPGTLNF